MIHDISLTHYWTEARNLILKKEFEKARIILDSLVKNHDHIELLLDYAQTLHLTGNVNKAESIAHHVLVKDPKEIKAYLLLGNIYYRKGLFQSALLEYKKILSIEPKNQLALVNIVYSYCSLSDFENAIPYIEEVIISIDQAPFNWLVNCGMAYLFNKKPLQAIPYLTQASIKITNDAQVFFHLGLAHDLSSNKMLAILYYQKAIIIDPDLLSAHHNLAVLHYSEQDYEKAIPHLKKIIQINPHHQIATTLLNAYSGNNQDTLSSIFISSLFDQYAFNYDEHLKTTLNYQAPSLSRNLLNAAATKENLSLSVGTCLDLGCGTGLMGIIMRDLATTLIGVDLSEGMIVKAKNNFIYDKIIQQDVIEYLTNNTSKVEYISAIELLNYLGSKIEDFIKLCSLSLSPGGWLLLTSEICFSNDKKILTRHARYAYNENYLLDLLKKNGFLIKETKKSGLRTGPDGEVIGLYIISQLPHKD